jgi:hypothetical protein
MDRQSFPRHVPAVHRTRGDRLFATANESLFSNTSDSCLHGTFRSVDESLYNIAGCDPVGSFKTADRLGNLQLSFFRRRADGKLLVDMDIDDAQGSDHIFQMLSNEITGEPTDPYNTRSSSPTSDLIPDTNCRFAAQPKHT